MILRKQAVAFCFANVDHLVLPSRFSLALRAFIEMNYLSQMVSRFELYAYKAFNWQRKLKSNGYNHDDSTMIGAQKLVSTSVAGGAEVDG